MVIDNTIYKHLLKSILAMLFICFAISVSAQGDTSRYKPQQSGEIGLANVRVPAKEKIEEYQKDSRFQYDEVKNGISLSDKFLHWLISIADALFKGGVQSGILGVIIILAIVFVVVLIILKLMGVKFKALFGKKDMDTPEIDIYTENVHEMNFDALINNALENKNYRLAVRFLYLKNLKLLSDKTIIKWNINKTNYSYQYEIADAGLRSRFLETTFIFDYVWYGEFPINEQAFFEIQARMTNFNQTVGNER